MAVHPLAGKPVPLEILVNVNQLVAEYQNRQPDLGNPQQLVSFGTSGHRGTSLDGTFTAAHILAITQAICEYRAAQGIKGPLFLGHDTHALSEHALASALEVLAANGIDTILQTGTLPVPTPVISHAILGYNRGRTEGLADGIIITPSHNPPADGGFKYNPPNAGPADTDATQWIQDRANALLRAGSREVKRVTIEAARKAPTTREADLIRAYVDDLKSVLDMDAIRGSGLRLGVDPLGGASVNCWGPIAETYKLNLSVVNPAVDPTFSFMSVDHDGKIRMDCSSAYAMAKLVGLKDQFDVAFGSDPDADRHGIVTPSAGLLNPNHYLAVAIQYLLTHRPGWSKTAGVGKTLVSSSLIDRVVASLGRPLNEVPVGFKWFVDGLYHGTCVFGGEESAGASFLRKDGTVWTTDKDGPLLCLLAAEIMAKTGRDPGLHFKELAAKFGMPLYTRIDQAATPEQKTALKKLSPEAVKASTLAGEPITARLTRAPGNNAAIGGLKVTTANGWFAARPSGTENVYKIYAESFRDEAHLASIVSEAKEIVMVSLGSA